MTETNIPIQEFAKIKLRTGKIISAEPVEGADRLYRVQVDIGGETRQSVAGIRKWYEPEQLVGRTVIFVANLEPAVIRGVESHGMCLAVDAPNGVSLLQPDRPVPPGCGIR